MKQRNAKAKCGSCPNWIPGTPLAKIGVCVLNPKHEEKTKEGTCSHHPHFHDEEWMGEEEK